MSIIKLNEQLTSGILTFLNVKAAAPTLFVLEKLLAAYYCTVPWESVFRIVRRAETAVPSPRWPNQFWQEAMTCGSGGTCFESNYAFFALLQTLGYEGYLTINNMGSSIGCHTAIVVVLDGQKWLVGENGLFLDFVIVNKIINNEPWRFNMAERPWQLNRFEWGQRIDTPLNGDVATAVAEHFGLDTAVVQQAFNLTQHNYPNN